VQKIFLLFLLVLGMVGIGMAKGTPANTPIANQAHIAYAVGGIDNNLSSNTDTFVVDRIVDIHTAWEDSASVKVSAGDHGRVLTFRVTNEGNGEDNLTLAHDHNTSSDFAAAPWHLFVDTNHNGTFDPGTDTAVSGALSLAADANVTIFFVGDIPDNNTTVPGAKAYEILRAASESNATAGADNPEAVDVVVRQGEDAATGIYEVLDYWLESNKTAALHSGDGQAHTGTRITYTIALRIGGNAAGKTIGQVVLTDAVPPHTRYVPHTLRLNGASKTDAADGDNGQCDGTTVRVDVGTISGTTTQKITFDVEIQ